MPPVDLFSLVFEQFLKISPQLISKYPTVPDQLLYLILIPHVILILFLISFSDAFAGHAKLSKLLAITTYIFILWSGWYGTFIVPVITSFFTITIIAAFATFIFVRIFHPLRIPGAAVAALEIGKGIKSRLKEENLEEQLEEVNKLLRNIGVNVKYDEEVKIDEKLLEGDKKAVIIEILSKRNEIIRKIHKRW